MNPLFQPQKQPQSLQNLGGARQMLQMIKMSQNPLESLKAICGDNPALQMTLDICQGRNPQEVFFEECQRKGIDPESILSQIR